MLLSELPSSARLWIFCSDDQLVQEKQEQLTIALEEFFKVWESHNVPVKGALEIYYNQFVIVSGYCEDGGISGCSTDSLFRVVTDLANQLEIKLEVTGDIFFKENGSICRVNAGEFEKIVNAGKVDFDTVVFNNSITTLKEFNTGKWETSFSKSWHATRFPLN